jgi:DNA-binding PadR family transcriptional regulator
VVGGVAQRRKVNNLLALNLLTVLKQRPMHPYEMATTMRDYGKDQSTKINWGSLYTVVGNLEKHGFIEATETQREGKRPERTVYRLTPAGEEELRDWLRELVGQPEREYHRFETALSLIAVLGPDEAVGLLRQRAMRLDGLAAAGEAMVREVGKEVSRIFLIEGEYYAAMLRAESAWIKALLAEIAAGEFPQLDVWRRHYESGKDEWEVGGTRPDDLSKA